jgi:hypothetical protein
LTFRKEDEMDAELEGLWRMFQGFMVPGELPSKISSH